MRPIETVLIVANPLALILLVIPAGWARVLVPLVGLVAIFQWLVEGPRWQMIPAYLLSGLICLIWLLQIAAPATAAGTAASGLFRGLAIGLGGIWLVVSTALPVLLPVFHFPQPTGPYPIGTLTYHWVDTSRPELFTPDPNDHRELMVQVWYPARPNPSAPRASYIQEVDTVTLALERLMHLPAHFLSHFKYVTTNAVASAPAADNPSGYPVLIYFTGLDGFRAASTFQVEELVSHGYIVAGIDQPGAVAAVVFPDGRQIPGWSKAELDDLVMQSVEPQADAPRLQGTALPEGIIPYFAQDASFTLDQLSAINLDDPEHILTGRLDLSRVGVFGISLGGMNAGELCLKDSRVKAGIIMDVWITADVVRSGLQQPTLFITRDADTMRLEHQRSGGWTEKDIDLTLTTMRAAYERLAGDGYYLQIPSLFHLNFTDAPYWLPISAQTGLTGPINSQRGFDILNAYSLAFFDRNLKGQPSPLLEGPAQQYPEVIFEKRRP